MTTKERVLFELEEANGEAVSGEALAAKLGISRASVWKAVRSLRDEGHTILAGTNQGYSLSSEDDLLSAHRIAACLRRDDSSNIHVFSSVDSTNLTAKKMILDGAPFGTVILAESQTNGRGRLGRGFYSPPGKSIYASFILKPDADTEKTQLYTVAASLAVCRAVERVADDKCQIKWVNDVYTCGRKICGILTEGISDMETGRIESIVLGIGINCNMTMEDFPADIQDRAGSISLPPGKRNNLAAALIEEVYAAISSLHNGSALDEYRLRSMVIGQEIYVITHDEKKEALAVGIHDNGGLLVKYPDGGTQCITSGEISIRLR